MLVKAVLLFLLVVAVLGWVGRLLRPSRRPPAPRGASCPACGRPGIGRAPCPCGTA